MTDTKALDRLVALLKSRRDEWIPSTQIARVTGWFSHSQRISDARKLGYQIECHAITVKGKRRTSYRLVTKAKAA